MYGRPFREPAGKLLKCQANVRRIPHRVLQRVHRDTPAGFYGQGRLVLSVRYRINRQKQLNPARSQQEQAV